MKSWISVFILFLVGCENPVSVVIADEDGGLPDASGPDASVETDSGPHSATCTVPSGSAWRDIPAAVNVSQKFGWDATGVALHNDDVLVFSQREMFVAGPGAEAWQPLSTTGLPSSLQLHAVHWVDDRWWANASGLSDPSTTVNALYSWDESAESWRLEQEIAEHVAAFVQTSSRTFLYTTTAQLLRRDEEGRWVPTTPLADATPSYLFDVEATDAYVYVVAQNSEPIVQVLRSTDGVAWENVTVHADAAHIAMLIDLAAAGSTVVASMAWDSESYFVLDEGAESAAFEQVASDHLVIPVWLGEDGTALGRTHAGGNDVYYVADSLGAVWTRLPDMEFDSFSLGIGSNYYYLQSLGGRIVNSRAINFSTRIVEESTNHGREWQPVVTATVPSDVYRLATDGASVIAIVADDNDSDTLMRLHDDETWSIENVPGVNFGVAGYGASVVGVGANYVTRPTGGYNSPPAISTDHGETWTTLDNSFPTYDSNVGRESRSVSSFAMTESGALYAGTVGGETALSGTGSKVPWAYRPGAGVWRRMDTNLWQPVNAGIPIEFPPDETGGYTPYRADIHSIVAIADQVYASLAGHGVYHLVADRWEPFGAGLPIDAGNLALAAVGETLVAWNATNLLILDGEIWVPATPDGNTLVLAARGGILIRGTESGVQVSRNAGATFEALPSLENVAQLVIADAAVYALTSDNRIHALTIECGTGE